MVADIFKVALRCWNFFTEDLLCFPSGSSVEHLNESPPLAFAFDIVGFELGFASVF